MGHTMSIHSRNDQIILEFGLKKPAYRIVVNTPTTHGSIGLTTGLDPSMTLGCGGWGGNITSDNISPRHLINIKRVAYETNPAVVSRPAPAMASAGASNVSPAVEAFVKSKLPRPPSPPPAPSGIPAEVLARRIDEFLGSRGYKPPATAAKDGSPAADLQRPAESSEKMKIEERPTDFVCEEDVRLAVRQARKIVIGERTIVTPAARDLGEQHRVFVQAEWPR
jgi:hypothetical protein